MDFVEEFIELSGGCSGLITVNLIESLRPRDLSTAYAVLLDPHVAAIEGQLKTQFGGLRRPACVAFTFTCFPFAVDQLGALSFKPASFRDIAEYEHGSHCRSVRVLDRGRRMVDWFFSSVLRDKYGVIRQLENVAF